MEKKVDDFERLLKLSREKLGETLVVRYDNGAVQVVRPTKAFDKNWRALASHLSNGEDHKFTVNNA